MFSPVSWASCSRMCRVGFGVATNAAFNVSSCLALMVVRGPRLLAPEFCSSFSILFVSLSEDVELSVSLMSSCIGSCRSGDKLLSVHDDTGEREGKQTRGRSRTENVREEVEKEGGGGGGGGGGLLHLVCQYIHPKICLQNITWLQPILNKIQIFKVLSPLSDKSCATNWRTGT